MRNEGRILLYIGNMRSGGKIPTSYSPLPVPRSLFPIKEVFWLADY